MPRFWSPWNRGPLDLPAQRHGPRVGVHRRHCLPVAVGGPVHRHLLADERIDVRVLEHRGERVPPRLQEGRVRSLDLGSDALLPASPLPSGVRKLGRNWEGRCPIRPNVSTMQLGLAEAARTIYLFGIQEIATQHPFNRNVCRSGGIGRRASFRSWFP